VLIEVGDKYRKLRQPTDAYHAKLAQETATENVRVYNARYAARRHCLKTCSNNRHHC
jgi:hypothetical protein